MVVLSSDHQNYAGQFLDTLDRSGLTRWKCLAVLNLSAHHARTKRTHPGFRVRPRDNPDRNSCAAPRFGHFRLATQPRSASTGGMDYIRADIADYAFCSAASNAADPRVASVAAALKRERLLQLGLHGVDANAVARVMLALDIQPHHAIAKVNRIALEAGQR